MCGSAKFARNASRFWNKYSVKETFSERNPSLHIETWRTSNVWLSYKTVIQGTGCIAMLRGA